MKLKLTSLTIICTMMLIACDSSNESSQQHFQSDDTGFTATYQNAVYTSKDGMSWIRKANIGEKDTCAYYPCQMLGWKVYAVVK